MKRCIELLRVSTIGQADADRASLPSQRTVNRQTASRYDLAIIHTIEMAGVSGAAVLLAPEMQEMIRLIADPMIHGVITREFSRLMRPENFADYALLQSFVDTSTILYLPDGPIDFSSDSGMILGTVHATLGGIERKQMKRKIWAAREEKRRKGELGGSKAILPFGVTYPWAWTADAEKVREAFRLFLAGQNSYIKLSQMVGVTVAGLRSIMHNPIYTGWRVIDKKRDMTLAGLYPTPNGRQGDRRKVKRAPEDVIRVRIPALDPLLSESEFQRVQEMMEIKRSNSLRAVENQKPRFTYNGFINCICGALVYTKKKGRPDYYLCSRKCGVKYMRRERLESVLDSLFGQRLTDPKFLQKHILAPLAHRVTPRNNTAILEAQLTTLQNKRKRIMDAYFEGVIDAGERDQRGAAVDREIVTVSGLIGRERPNPGLDLETLHATFRPFAQFDLLSRDDKRTLLNTVAPQIIAANYQIEGLWISLDGGHKSSHTDTDSLVTPRHYLKLAIAA